MMPLSRWSEQEKLILRSIYRYAQREQVLEALPGRTWVAVKSKACLMRVRRKVYEHTLHDRIWVYFKMNPNQTIRHIGKKFGRSPGTISKILTKQLSKQ
jgi:hypothetical protein